MIQMLGLLSIAFTWTGQVQDPVSAGWEWTLPKELALGDEEGMKTVLDVLQMAEGTPGVLIESNRRLFLWTASGPGRHWTRNEVGPGVTGCFARWGDRVAVIVSGLVDGLRHLDLERGALIARGQLSKVPATFLQSCESGGSAFVLAAGEGPVRLYSRDKAAKSWTEIKGADDVVGKIGQFWVPWTGSRRGMHLFEDPWSDGLVHRLSEDGGKTWREQPSGPSLNHDLGKPTRVIADASGESLHVVCLTDLGNLIHAVSRDEGRRWEPSTILARGAGRTPPAIGFSGDMGAVAFRDEAKPRVLLSRDGGKTWSEEAGVARGIIVPNLSVSRLWVRKNGSLSVLLTAWKAVPAPAWVQSFVLHRSLEPAVPAVPLGAEERTRAIKMIGELGHDDPVVRDKASRTLEKMGTRVRELLRDTLDRAPDAETGYRIEQLLRQDVSPAWWKDP